MIKITDDLVTTVLPHLRDAVEANCKRWEAELAMEKAMRETVEGFLEHYEHLCIPLSEPQLAQSLVTEKDCRLMLESIASALE
jgi:hypothetical protein